MKVLLATAFNALLALPAYGSNQLDRWLPQVEGLRRVA